MEGLRQVRFLRKNGVSGKRTVGDSTKKRPQLPGWAAEAAFACWSHPCANSSLARAILSRIFTPKGQLGSHLPHIRQSSAVAERDQ